MKQQLKLICEQNLLETGEFMVRSGKTKVSVYKESPSSCKAARWSALLLWMLFSWVFPLEMSGGNDNPPVSSDTITTSGGADETGGDPISIVKGEVLLEEVDLVIPSAIMNLNFSRAWNSSYNENTVLGDGWSHSFDWKLNDVAYAAWQLNSEVYQGVSGLYVSLDAFVNPIAGKYKGGRYLFRLIPQDEYTGGDIHTCVEPTYIFTSVDSGMQGAYLSVNTNATEWTLAGIGGNRVRYIFDGDGRLKKIDHPLGSIAELTYTNGVLASVTNRFGNGLNFEYNSTTGRLIKVSSNQDTNLWVEYSRTNYSSGDYTKMFQATRHVSSNSADNLDYKYYYQAVDGFTTYDVVAKKENPVGDCYYWDYEYSGIFGLRGVGSHIVSGLQTNIYETSFSYTFPAENIGVTEMVSTLSGNATATRVYTNDLVNSVSTQIQGPLANQLQNRVFNISGDLVTNRFKLGDEVFLMKTTFDTNRNPVGLSSAYDRYGSSTPLNTDVILSWNSERLVSEIRDASNRGIGIQYRNSLPVKVDALCETNDTMTLGLFNYNTGGLLTSITNANNHVTTISYTTNSTKTEVTILMTPPAETDTSYVKVDSLWRLKEIGQYDTAGNLAVTGIRTDYAGRPLAVTNALNQVSSFEYDKVGRLIRAQDAGGRVMTNTWRLGKLISSTVGWSTTTNRATISFDYDPQMTTLHIKDPLNRVVEGYVLDAEGRATTVTNVDGQTMTISRGVLGMINEINRFDDSTIYYYYDEKGGLCQIDYPGSSVILSRLTNGLISGITGGNGNILLAYDKWNRLVNSTSAVDGIFNISSSYAYDNAGNLKTNTINLDSSLLETFLYTYDENERLSSATSPNNVGTWNYRYNPYHGGLVCVSNSVSQINTEYEYDSLGRVTRLAHKKPAGGGALLLKQVVYTYDASGLIATKTVSGAGLETLVTTYSYNALGQLTSERTPGLVTNTYTYNAAGNRTYAVLKGVSSTYTTPAAHNRLASWAGGGSMTYNTAGCVTALNRANKVDVSSLNWDSQYQLTSAVAGNIGVYYSYDALGRKIERLDGDGGYEYYFYDGNQIVADFDGNEWRVIRSYTYGPGIDNILSMTVHGSTSTNTYYYLKDLSNTVLSLVNASGIAVEYYEYDAYGNVTIRNGSGTVIPASAYGNRYLFQGREYDYTTQLYHFRARWYDSETGRWLSNDPIGISGGLNLYAFCSNDPVNFVDPMGFYSKYSNATLLAEEGCGFGTFTDPDTGEEIGGAQVLGMMVGGAADGLAIVAGGGLGGAAAAGIAAAVVDDLINDATNTSGSEDCCPDDSGYAVNAAGGVMCGVGGGDSPAAQYGREQHKKLKEKVKQKGVLWSPEKTFTLNNGKKFRPDVITPSGKIIELKPNTPSGRRQGARQLARYIKSGIAKKGRLIFYSVGK